MVHILRCVNSDVTDFYLDAIGKMFQARGEQYEFFTWEALPHPKKEIIVVSTCLDFYRMWRKGYSNLVYWVQGIVSEESFLIHKSHLRKRLLDYFTSFALKRCRGVIYVSARMKAYLEKKFHLDTGEKVFLMPCFNDTLDREAFFHENKYRDNVFCYVGSLSKWQCFDKTVQFYKKIEEIVPNTRLMVFTREKEEAKRILSESGIQNYSVDFSAPEELKKHIAVAKFGFVLRDDIAVNQVATPTKLSSYLSAGVIPVFSDCLDDFCNAVKGTEYTVAIGKDFLPTEKLLEFCRENPAPEKVLREYEALFNSYYSTSFYINSAGKWIQGILDRVK